MTTLKQARADLAAKITTVVADPAVDVLAYEPPTVDGDTITVATAGVEPTEWLLAIRIYTPANQPEEAQDRLDDLTVTVDTAANLSVIPRGGWAADFDEPKNAFVMTAVVGYPRDDF